MTGAFNQIQTIQQAKEIISLLKIIMGEKKKSHLQIIYCYVNVNL